MLGLRVPNWEKHKMIVDAGETRVPIKRWASFLEQGTLEQARNMANLPFAYHHVGLMPDAHPGYGMPIGGVLATRNVIVPNAVGVDIGCGMCAVKTPILMTDVERDWLKVIMGATREVIPVGFDHHKDRCPIELMPEPSSEYTMPIVDREFESARSQLGTLGGGNHFIEFQSGEDGHLWVMIHSGSRNIGLKVAHEYNNIAKVLNERWHSLVPRAWDLAFLPVDSPEGQQYLYEMDYCVLFAYANRKRMMKRILDILDVNPLVFHNIAHNYVAIEHHFNHDVWVHRKGATRAREGEPGIIPGSQGTKSYITEGLGNPESFTSCSHGAGRKMGRKAATLGLDLTAEIAALNEKGIIHSVRNVNDLDEAPGAYKDIDQVMRDQEDLTKILTVLTPLGVIKG
jgi:tRNA-splicing ligase RtcB (3'-phosphate/5'-hydroxy nucleic acid ligase)